MLQHCLIFLKPCKWHILIDWGVSNNTKVLKGSKTETHGRSAIPAAVVAAGLCHHLCWSCQGHMVPLSHKYNDPTQTTHCAPSIRTAHWPWMTLCTLYCEENWVQASNGIELNVNEVRACLWLRVVSNAGTDWLGFDVGWWSICISWSSG